MILTLCFIALLFLVNTIVGAIVLDWIDRRDGGYIYEWYSDTPVQIVGILLLNLWPFFLLGYALEKREHQR